MGAWDQQKRLERIVDEDWFVAMERAWKEAIVLGLDDLTYKGRAILPDTINYGWVASRMDKAGITGVDVMWVLQTLMEKYPPAEDPVPIPNSSVLESIRHEWG